jgi:lipopolysaccharide heptosyltransferase II
MIRSVPRCQEPRVRIGVLLPNWVGDVAMATPTLRTLRQHLPDARIVGIARPYLIPLLSGTPWLDAILPWEHKGRGRIGRTWRVVRQLRDERLDVLILLRATLSAGVLARLSGATYTIGYTRRGLGWLLSHPVHPLDHEHDSPPVSAVDAYLNLLSPLGLLPQSRELELATTPADEAAADGVWRRLALPPGERVMLLSTGGAYGQAKHWPAEYCVSLALRAAAEFGLTTLVLCGPHERATAAAIELAAGHPQVRSLANEDVSFGTTKAIVRRSRLMVTTDSGPRHIASAFGTPTVVLFGPIDPRVSRNYQRESIELSVPLDCAPCGQRVCPLGHHRCMRDLTVDRVLAAVGRMLQGSEFTVQGSGDDRRAA